MKIRNIYLYGLLSAICFGAITTIGKLALLELTPPQILVIRFSIVIGILLAILALSRNLKLIKLKDKKLIMLLSGIFLAIETSLFWFGLNNLTIIELLALFWTYPLFILIIDIILKKVKNLWKSTILLLVGFVGVFLASGGLEALL